MRMYDFKQKLLDIINNSGLTIEEAYYVWKELFEEITNNYNNSLIQEEQEKLKQQEQEQEENKKEE